MTSPHANNLTVIVIGTNVNWIARIMRTTNIGPNPRCISAWPEP